jgi:hypothetical protein
MPTDVPRFGGEAEAGTQPSGRRLSGALTGARLSLQAGTMESLFGAVSAQRHAAPSARLAAGPVKEEQRAG